VKHPIQPLAPDERGTVRFKPNVIVRWLLDEGPFDMNQIAMKRFPVEDQEQFAQLIGYSLSGFSELSYVRDETYGTAAKMSETGQTEDQARIAHLEEVLETVRSGLRIATPALFRIHPDDLGGE
jgi:hypothetical protein